MRDNYPGEISSSFAGKNSLNENVSVPGSRKSEDGGQKIKSYIRECLTAFGIKLRSSVLGLPTLRISIVVVAVFCAFRCFVVTFSVTMLAVSTTSPGASR